jgi:hypothetical protein
MGMQKRPFKLLAKCPGLTVPVAGSLIGVLLIVLLFSPLMSPNLQNGDSVVYNHQVELRELGKRTTHFGYYLLGMICDALSPADTDTTMNFMCLLFGALGGLAVFWLTYFYSDSYLLALMASLLALSSRSYLKGMILSEVDVVHAALTVIGVALFQRKAPAAGLAYGLALLVSPLAALMLPLFLLNLQISSEDRLRHSIMAHLKRLLMFGLSSAMVYVPVVAYHFKDYFWGYRGIFTAPRVGWDPAEGIRLSVKFFSQQGLPLLPLIMVGVALACTSRSHRERGTLAIAALVAVLVAALFGERFGGRVPVQLPTYLVLCSFPALLGAYLRASKKWWLVPLAAFLVTFPGSLSWASSELSRAEATRARNLAIKASSSPHEAMVIGMDSWHNRMLFERHVHGKPYAQRAYGWKAFDKLETIAADGDDVEIWVVGKLSPARENRLSPRFQSEKRQLLGQEYTVFAPR